MKYSSKMAENRRVNTELKNKPNKHAAEQREKLSDLKELQSMQFYKNYYIRLNSTLKKSLPALDVAFQSLSLAPSFQKKTTLQV